MASREETLRIGQGVARIPSLDFVFAGLTNVDSANFPACTCNKIRCRSLNLFSHAEVVNLVAAEEVNICPVAGFFLALSANGTMLTLSVGISSVLIPLSTRWMAAFGFLAKTRPESSTRDRGWSLQPVLQVCFKIMMPSGSFWN